jgi:hypothetical protein
MTPIVNAIQVPARIAGSYAFMHFPASSDTAGRDVQMSTASEEVQQSI